MKIIFAQCSLCAKTAEQLGSEAVKGLNNGIIYLIVVPVFIMGLGYWFYVKYYK